MGRVNQPVYYAGIIKEERERERERERGGGRTYEQQQQ
jgi:hypothetical protein